MELLKNLFFLTKGFDAKNFSWVVCLDSSMAS